MGAPPYRPTRSLDPRRPGSRSVRRSLRPCASVANSMVPATTPKAVEIPSLSQRGSMIVLAVPRPLFRLDMTFSV